MGRGSSASRKSNEPSATKAVGSAMKKKAGTWEAPKGVSMLPLTLQDELANLELEIKKKMDIHLLLAERQVDQLKGLVEAALIFLPKDVQNMNVRDYVQRFGGNLNAFADHEKKRVMNVNSSRGAEAATKRRSAARKKISEVATLRAQKKGHESISSSSLLNSSTASVPSTPGPGTTLNAAQHLVSIQASRTPGGTHTNRSPVVTVWNGMTYVEMTENVVRTLDPIARETAGQQLENLSARLQKMQEQLFLKPGFRDQ